MLVADYLAPHRCCGIFAKAGLQHARERLADAG
jgi:hypothetical protein